MAISLQIAIAGLGVAVALFIIGRIRHAEARVRALRLEVMDRKTTAQAAKLNAILLAENARLVAKGIDQGSLIMQGGHKVLSEVTFGLLQLFPVTREHAKIVKDTHNLISEGLYGAFRVVSKQVGDNIAESIKAEQPAAKKKSGKLRHKKQLKRRKP